MTENRNDDGEFLARLAAVCPCDVRQTPDLAARIMADFDALSAARAKRPSARLRAWLMVLWPGALWQPGMALAASLAVGLVVGALAAPGATAMASRDATQSQTSQVQSADNVPVVDLLGDLS